MRVIILLLLLVGAAVTAVQVDQADFDARSQTLNDKALADGRNRMGIAPIQAFEGVAIPQSSIDALLNGIDQDPKADFRIVQLIRILFLDTTKTYEKQILDAITTFPYWLTPNEPLRVYWSENHHSMWMSSAFLLQQENPSVSGDDPVELRTRLVSYLETKIQYGYYEFFSTLYLPYTLSGLLNLIDFSLNAEIQSLAQQAADRLVTDLLKGVNSEGVLFPAAGRNKASKYLPPAYESNHDSIVWLMTGLGVEPTTVYHVGAFLTTSTNFDVTNIDLPQDPYYDVLDIGHSLALSDTVHGDLNSADRTIAQFSYGGYFHPDLVDDTLALFDAYDLWDHEEFDGFSIGEEIPPGLFTFGTRVLKHISKSSVLVQEYIAIFRNGPAMLSSVQDYFKGKLGYQQFPWMATVGTLGVWTQSGISQEEGAFSRLTTNTHLPYIQQNENMALIMYKPDLSYEPLLRTIGIDNFDIKLHWPEGDFTETDSVGKWYLGAKDDAYIAVRSHCGKLICPFDGSDKRQTWAVVVGSAAMYGDFGSFRDSIQGASYEERRRFDWRKFKYYYFGRVRAKNPDSGDITIKYNWPISFF